MVMSSVLERQPRRNAMENRIKTDPNTDKTAVTVNASRNADNTAETIEKGKGERLFRADVEQDLSEYEQQQILHEVNTGHHEHQQKDDLKICLGLVKTLCGLPRPSRMPSMARRPPG